MTINIHKDASLQPYNTMAVPARADYLVEVNSIDEIEQALAFVKQHDLPNFVLGEGSNTLFTKDYPGLIILNRLLGLEVIKESDQHIYINVCAGENWHRLVTYAVEQGWYGLENLALIPGLVGAAPIQNIGAYGVEIKDFIVSVDFLDIESHKVEKITNAECGFAYRDSIFKHAKYGKGIITSVTFRLNKKPQLNTSYPSLADRLVEFESLTAKNVFDAVVAIRNEKLPSPDLVPNSGSFFKNPVVDVNQHERLKEKYPNLISFPYQAGFKLAAGWLIESAGWKSKIIENVSVHPNQALVVINPEKVKGESIIHFALQLRSNIHQKFGITLEIEPNII